MSIRPRNVVTFEERYMLHGAPKTSKNPGELVNQRRKSWPPRQASRSSEGGLGTMFKGFRVRGVGFRDYPQGPSTPIVDNLGLHAFPYRYFGPKLHTICVYTWTLGTMDGLRDKS